VIRAEEACRIHEDIDWCTDDFKATAKFGTVGSTAALEADSATSTPAIGLMKMICSRAGTRVRVNDASRDRADASAVCTEATGRSSY
jgi:hypothetical protein